MHNSTRISIVTPSYNQGKYIERTIQSVLSQDVRGLEYAVIDGGSADESVSILKRYGDRFFWISERDRGPSDAINKGFRRSSGPVLGWLNSDDIYYQGALKTVLEFFDKNPDVDVIYGDTYHIDENDKVIEKYPTEDWNWTRLHETCFISQPAAFFRRSVFDDYGPLDVGVRCMDYEYWLRLGKNRVRFAHLPRILAATRLHKEAFSVAERVAGHKEVNCFTRKHLSRTPDRWLFNYAHAIAEAKGYDRRRPLSFLSALVFNSLRAAFHWNKSVTPNMARILAAWIIEHLVSGLRREDRVPPQRRRER